MKKTRSSLLALAVSAVAAVSVLQAQDAIGEKNVKCRFRLCGWDEPITDLYYSHKGEDIGMVIYQDARSIFYDYMGHETVTFYRLKADSEGKVVREPAARANLANGGHWPLILFSKDPSKPGTYQTMVLKDDLVAFPPGSYAFSNFTTSVVGGYLGIAPFVLSPGESKLVEGKPKTNGTTLAALFYKTTGTVKEPIYTNNWAIRPAMRTRVFVRISPENPTGMVARRLVESTVFPPEKKDAQGDAN